MTLRTFDSAEVFYEAARPLLLGDEAKYGLQLGIALHLRDGGSYSDKPPWLALLLEGDEPVVASLQTPPYPLQLTDATEEQVTALVDALLERGEPLPGVVAPAETAATFGAAWSRAAGVRFVEHMPQAVHRLDRVEYVPDIAGHMRVARPDEFSWLQKWAHRFAIDCRMPDADEPPKEIRGLDQGRVYLWVDGEPVSMAAWSRPTPNGVCVNYVYTPDELRGRGYASAVVAALSQKLLDDGRRFCCLFTDLTNPISNRIYYRIGYRRVCDYRHDFFEPL